jgi:hypothetical protein
MKFVSIVLAGTLETWITSEGKHESILNYPVTPKKTVLSLSIENYKSDFLTLVATSTPLEDLLLPESLIDSIVTYGVKKSTKGALSTLSLLVDIIPDDIPIVVAPADGIVDVDINDFVQDMYEKGFDCGIIAFEDINQNYSYARQYQKQVIEIAEKKVIGNLALSGTYYFRNLTTLLECIHWAYLNNASTKGAFYISSAINGLIADQKRVGIFEIQKGKYYRYSTISECEITAERHRNEKV